MKTLTENQKIIIKSIFNDVTSLEQHYYSTVIDVVYTDREANLYCNINKEIEQGTLIPFVPAYDL